MGQNYESFFFQEIYLMQNFLPLNLVSLNEIATYGYLCHFIYIAFMHIYIYIYLSIYICIYHLLCYIHIIYIYVYICISSNQSELNPNLRVEIINSRTCLVGKKWYRYWDVCRDEEGKLKLRKGSKDVWVSCIYQHQHQSESLLFLVPPRSLELAL